MADEKYLFVLLERAIQIAVEVHAGQLDKAGMPYILHPLRVMNSVNGVVEKIVAVLHDTMEDSYITPRSLMAEGFPDHIIDAIISVSRQEGEVYMDYIKRASENTIGKIVKMADLRDNSDIFRLDDIEEKHISLMRRYHKAMKFLQE